MIAMEPLSVAASRSEASQPAVALPQLRRVGEAAILLDCDGPAEALRVFAALKTAREARAFVADELIPAASTVLVRGGAARRATFPGELRSLLLNYSPAEADVERAGEISIPVIYRGEDLEEVAAHTGITAAEVVTRHSAMLYTVAFTGFAPGFAYLSGGDPRLVVPRRAVPRPRIPSGAVALAGEYSGVYPRESPGGWQVIGRTELKMWDLDRPEPALLRPGGLARFQPIRERLRAADTASGPSAQREQTEAPTSTAQATLEIIRPGLQALIQDAGRPHRTALGVGTSGAADRCSLARANRLVGNEEGATVIELSQGGFSARALRTSVLAIAGAPRPGRISGPRGVREVPGDRAFRIDEEEVLAFDPPDHGARTALAIRGGVSATRVLGSTSHDTLAGLGPAPLKAAEIVWAEPAGRRPVGMPESHFPNLPRTGGAVTLRVVPGPRTEWFADPGELWAGSWEVTPRSDRVGVRLSGPALTRAADFRARELPSEGLVPGAIQVPTGGQPLLFLADHPITGGYPVIGVVCEADQSLAAQLPPGTRVSFTRLDRAEFLPSPTRTHRAAPEL